MSIVNIISAIGNNKSVYPLLVRDCGIEVPTKVVLTYNQNKEDKDIAYLATRERLIDEYSTSAVWLGGIPLIEKINKLIFKKKGFMSDVDSKLLKEDKLQGLEYNIKKFKDLAPNEIKDLEYIKNNASKYNKLLTKSVISVLAIPIALMGFVIPKLIFAWTASTKKQIEEKRKQKFEDKNNQINFKGSMASSIIGLTTPQKMFITDGGYAIGRVVTARNKDAAIDIGFKMVGMMFLNFVFPKILANFLDKTLGSFMKTNLNLDIKLLNDKEFINSIKNNSLKFEKLTDEKQILDYIDSNPLGSFTKLAQRYDKVKMLKNGVRDPRKYVDTKDLKSFYENILDLVNAAKKSGNIEKFMKKTSTLKGINIISNIAISSFLLAFALPKTQFAFRKKVLKQTFEPGIALETTK